MAKAPPPQIERLDHVMLWTDNVDRTTAVFAVKLGFQVRPGGDFGDGIANRVVFVGDEDYIELLYTTKPEGELDADARTEIAAVRAGTGARTFAVHPAQLDAVDAYLRSRGFDLNPPTPMNYDPDGPGPKPAVPAQWRTASFVKPPFTTGDVFFIQYAKDELTPVQRADRALSHEHPNGARAWDGVWLLSSDLNADRAAFARMGFTEDGEVDLAQLAARGVRLRAGHDSIVLLEPKGDGLASQALAKRGGHVFGLSLGVDDIERAQRRVKRGYGIEPVRYAGLDGDSILAPTYDDLGLYLEFHAMPRAPAAAETTPR